MAKAKEIAGLDCMTDALESAALVLRVRFEEIVELRDAALDFSDIEGVHDMRVATRRLRSALRDFLPLMNKRSLRNVRKELKAVADALGAVRDEDVAIDALEKLQTETESEQIKSGVEALLNERRQVREQARANLIKAIDVNNMAQMQEEFIAAVDEAVRKTKQSSAASFKKAGSDVIAASLNDLCDLSDSLYAPFQVEELHEMRIASKRLRYAVELFTACWGDEIAQFAGEISNMQSFLGEVHDCDVWIESLGERLRQRKNGSACQNERQASIWLLSEFSKKRNRNYRDALKLWSDWEASNFTQRMRALIS